MEYQRNTHKSWLNTLITITYILFAFIFIVRDCFAIAEISPLIDANAFHAKYYSLHVPAGLSYLASKRHNNKGMASHGDLFLSDKGKQVLAVYTFKNANDPQTYLMHYMSGCFADELTLTAHDVRLKIKGKMINEHYTYRFNISNANEKQAAYATEVNGTIYILHYISRDETQNDDADAVLEQTLRSMQFKI